MKLTTLDKIIRSLSLCEKNDLNMGGVMVYNDNNKSFLCAGNRAFINVIEVDDDIKEGFFPHSCLDHLKAILKENKNADDFSCELLLSYVSDNPKFPTLEQIRSLQNSVKSDNKITIDFDYVLKAIKALEACHVDKRKKRQITINSNGKNSFLTLESNDKNALCLVAPIVST